MPIPLVTSLISAIVDAVTDGTSSATAASNAGDNQQIPLNSFASIPAGTKKGTLQASNGFEVLLDGKACQLAPGAQIRDSNNLLIMPFALEQQVPVRYLQNDDGQLTRAWVISSN